MVFTMLQVQCSRRTTDRASFTTSLALIGSLYPGAFQGLCQFSRGHLLFFRTVPPALTLVNGWVNENAFAPKQQARPCPTNGLTGSSRGFPHRLRPGTSPQALQIPSRDGHPALRSVASGGFRFALAVSGFRLRARLDVSIPSAFFGQRGITPAFGYGAPHLSARGT